MAGCRHWLEHCHCHHVMVHGAVGVLKEAGMGQGRVLVHLLSMALLLLSCGGIVVIMACGAVGCAQGGWDGDNTFM